jgi:molecular chaperone GrpE
MPKSMKKKKTEIPGKQKQPDAEKDEREDLRSKIDNLQKEKDELFAQLQRVSADYDNLQKRTARQIVDTIGYEKEKIIKTILPALDNFEHTLQNAHSAENVDTLLKGIQIIYDQMLDVLKLHNVEQTCTKQ